MINKPTGLSSRPVATLKDSTRMTASPSDTQAPLLRHLLAEFAATGLPAAYIEFDDTADTSSTLEPTV